MKRPWNKKRCENASPVGSMVAEPIQTLLDKVDALETKFAAVLAAKSSDSGKTLLIDSNGKVKLST